MTDRELKALKDNLWHAADMLRASAHIAANKYGQPILGLIFLRYADILFKQHKAEIEAEFERRKGGRTEKTIKEISIEKCGFYLPECAYFDTINDAPDTAEKAVLVKKAMEAIEQENEKMNGVLPKEVYGQLVPEEEPELLSKIIRIFKDIPENISVDIFGEIYEYFLGNFALQEGKDGGTFYTPATVVRHMVEVLNPEIGNKLFLDPACGSGGMFVQAARYMHRHNASAEDMMKFMCYGVEKEPDTVKLAKMNLLLNNVRGDIREANSYYADPHNAVGRFDYVMANPPFNVDEVVYDKVKDDPRFNTYGVPKNKSKTGKKNADKKETVPNANYLWISYFASALNANGRAALVMANSASDAGGSEYEIRKKMIEEGVIQQMVTLPSNMFASVTLPATLWFFDKHKPQTEKKDEILFVDARNVFTQVDRAHRKFSDEQIKNLGIITRLYEGDAEAFAALLDEYRAALATAPETAEDKETKTKAYWQAQIDWLNERFPEGQYRDVTGLCKAAKLGISYEQDENGVLKLDKAGNSIKITEEDSIADQDYSLNAGRYVGVVIEDDGIPSCPQGQTQEWKQRQAEEGQLFGVRAFIECLEGLKQDGFDYRYQGIRAIVHEITVSVSHHPVSRLSKPSCYRKETQNGTGQQNQTEPKRFAFALALPEQTANDQPYRDDGHIGRGVLLHAKCKNRGDGSNPGPLSVDPIQKPKNQRRQKAVLMHVIAGSARKRGVQEKRSAKEKTDRGGEPVELANLPERDDRRRQDDCLQDLQSLRLRDEPIKGQHQIPDG